MDLSFELLEVYNCKFLHIKKNKGGIRPQDNQEALASSMQEKDEQATTPQDD